MTVRPRVGTPRRVFFLVLVAGLLLEIAWALSLPVFRGIDEFDHVYKAESVAHGSFADAGPAEHGRGGLVPVPPDVVAAAAARCRAYAYTQPDNCRPVAETGDGLVLVASAASAYNPAYYAIVGTVARPFHGAAAVFVMRTVTAVLAALLLAAAAAVTATWARTGWPLLAVVVAASPVLTYSGAVVSPNGLGYASGILLWASLLGLRVRPRPLHLGCATLAACVVLCTHSTGFLWLGITLLAVLLLAPAASWKQTILDLRGPATTAALVGAGALLATLAWIVAHKTNAPDAGTGHGPAMPWGRVPQQLLLWAVQSIAAFPLRDDPAPGPVYGLWLVPFVALLAVGVMQAGRRVRLSMTMMTIVWVSIPVVASLFTYATMAFAWQGRYALVLAVGFPALAAFSLDQREVRLSRWPVVATVVMCALANAWSVGALTAKEAHTPLGPDLATVVPGAPWLLAVVALAGSLLPLCLAAPSKSRHHAILTQAREPVRA